MFFTILKKLEAFFNFSTFGLNALLMHSGDRSSLPSPAEFNFEERLLDDYKGSLKAGALEANDLTIEALHEK